MTEETPDVFQRLKALAHLISNLAGSEKYGGAPAKAREKLPEWRRALDLVEIRPKAPYHGADVDPKHKMTAERIRESMREEYEATGRRERYEALIKCADDLERLSAELPALAAEVFMQAKRVADQLREEAEAGRESND